MKRVGMTWRVKPAHWEEYKQIHLDPWPELIKAIREVGIHNYSIFAFPQKDSVQAVRVFAYLEVDGDDVYEALTALAKTDVKKRWDEEVGIWVAAEAEEGSEIQFMELETIFYSQ